MNTPEKPRKMSRGEFLKAAAGVALGGLGVSACKTGESTPPTRVKGTVPTTIVPKTTTTAPSTTEAPTTTQAERTFASPEQQAQVEQVESNMTEFFKLTPDDLIAYKEKATFTPYPDGFNKVQDFYEYSARRVLAVNLGVFPISVGDGEAFIHMFGSISENGNKYVVAEILGVTESSFATQFDWFNEGRRTHTFDPYMEPNVYDASNNSLGFVDQPLIGMDNLVIRLNKTVGQPIALEYTTDPLLVRDNPFWNYPANPNDKMVIMYNILYDTSTKDPALKLSEYTPQEQRLSGIFTEPEKIPQEILGGYSTATELVSNLPLNGVVSLFNNTPSLLPLS